MVVHESSVRFDCFSPLEYVALTVVLSFSYHCQLVKVPDDTDLAINCPLSCGLSTGAGTVLNEVSQRFFPLRSVTLADFALDNHLSWYNKYLDQARSRISMCCVRIRCSQFLVHSLLLTLTTDARMVLWKLGAVGVSMVAAFSVSPASRIIVVDLHASRLETAKWVIAIALSFSLYSILT